MADEDTRNDIAVEIDQITENQWYEELKQFNDATIYQTWSYGKIRWKERCLSHLALKEGNEVIGLAQVAIKRIPILGIGIAYVPWGPLWSKKGRNKDNNIEQQVLHALRQEYSVRRGLVLRIAPNEIETNAEHILASLASEGFIHHSKPYRTLLIDLSQSLEELLKNSSRRWRRALKKASTEALTVSESTGDDSFDILGTLFYEMVARKGIDPGLDFNEFRAVQMDLPKNMKMKVLICKNGEKPVAALAASLVGEKGIGLLGATSTDGLNLGGFHLLNWKMIEWLMLNGARYYDFGGYNPDRNPGTATFKDGLSGEVANHIGHYEVCDNLLSRIFVKRGESLRAAFRRTQNSIKKMHNKTHEGDPIVQKINDAE